MPGDGAGGPNAGQGSAPAPPDRAPVPELCREGRARGSMALSPAEPSSAATGRPWEQRSWGPHGGVAGGCRGRQPSSLVRPKRWDHITVTGGAEVCGVGPQALDPHLPKSVLLWLNVPGLPPPGRGDEGRCVRWPLAPRSSGHLSSQACQAGLSGSYLLLLDAHPEQIPSSRCLQPPDQVGVSRAVILRLREHQGPSQPGPCTASDPAGLEWGLSTCWLPRRFPGGTDVPDHGTRL